MKEFDKIYLGWQRGLVPPRYIVGVIERLPENSFMFRYDKKEVEKAKKETGFLPYTEFGDYLETYNGNVLDIFAHRLMKPERPDIQDFYNFWEIDPKDANDKFYLLGHTQGYLPTDNFEFLADYNPVKGLHFITDLDGVQTLQLSPEMLAKDDELQVKFEHGNDIVSVYKNEIKVGHIKQIHCRIFHKPGAGKLKVKVKAIDKNGTIRRVFVTVYSE